MKRKHESMSTTPTAEDLVAEALQKFQRGMTSAFPPQRLRQFYSEDRIREVEQSERKKVFDEYYSTIMTFRGKNMARMVADLEAGIERITEKVLKANEYHKEAICPLIGKMMVFLCEEYKLWLETQLLSNPDMEPGKRKKLFDDEKARVLTFFSDHCNQWNAEVVQEQVSKLKEEVNKIQQVIEETHFGGAASSASTSVPAAEKLNFAAMEEKILETCEELKSSWNENSNKLKMKNGSDIQWKVLGSHLDRYVVQVEKVLQDEKYNQFSNKEYQETHKKLTRVLAMAIKSLSVTAETERTNQTPTVTVVRVRKTARKSTGGKAPKRTIAGKRVNGKYALMWERAFELDMRNCFSTQRASHQFKIDCQGFEFRHSKVTVKKVCKDIIHKCSKWKLKEFSSRGKLQEVVKDMELLFGFDLESIGGPPKLFTEQLYKNYNPREPEVESEEETGSSSDQDSDDGSDSHVSE